MTGHTPLRRRRRRRTAADLRRDSRGATAVEYGLIVALIVIVMIVALKQVARANTDVWQQVSTKVVNAG
ncbi:MAG: Flp family type IVb pilin [Sphingomonas sp.]|jgi:pilus assembly protein Flp/PilA|uniref:Flp family type IVb pilin n=1 Tax=Sphingomonas sp. CD22 TaxID=3100214 RepID=UPI00122B977D|nr:Flp family type IVb pilin [Sphingomonas sp. CD22]MEA1084925.1 Flp family type IVb pilin [Sphingomonas sp. CD22]RZL54943.1 MAG: Flp family type IVb pilin [Sphingomonas sp.]